MSSVSMFLRAICIVLLVFQSFASHTCLTSSARECKIEDSKSNAHFITDNEFLLSDPKSAMLIAR